jgi:selenide,water dikinase
VRFRIHFDALPRYEEALALIAAGVTTAVTGSNLAIVAGRVRFSGDLSEPERGLLVDPQTSGGLLVALPGDEAAAFVARLRERGVEAAAVIGDVLAADGEEVLEFVR